MSRARTVLFTGLLAAALSSPSFSQDKAAPNLPFAGPAPAEELQVLAPLVGQWTAKIDARPSVQDKDGYAATAQVTGEWLHNGHFLRLASTSTGAKFRGESTTLYTYDARKKVYRRWLFTSTGLATEAEGTWDAAKKTMTWKTLNLAPNVTGGVTDVFADDRVETTVLVKGGDGQTMVDVKMTATRKK